MLYVACSAHPTRLSRVFYCLKFINIYILLTRDIRFVYINPNSNKTKAAKMTDQQKQCKQRDKRKKQIKEIIATASITVAAVLFIAVLQTISAAVN